ncbi:MAG TPA: response regulator [Methanospirillum sp.]|nr:response regulator [Methanospirillum sp.]
MSQALKVLYIDDEALLKMAFVETLKQQGYNARGAISGKEALEQVDEETPDILILDVMMKPMDGWETLSHIRERPEGRTIPVIMQTGKSLTLKDVLKYGDQIEDYLIKPVRLPDLVRAIQNVLDRTRMIEEEVADASSRGGDPALIAEYAILRHKTIVGSRLIEVLGRIYPVTKEGIIETDYEIPELNDVVNRYTEDKTRFLELKTILF